VVGIQEAYTLKMIKNEFETPVPTWRIISLPGIGPDVRGALVDKGGALEERGNIEKNLPVE
jgi:hypothetical protein